jgi:hypothetical protein
MFEHLTASDSENALRENLHHQTHRCWFDPVSRAVLGRPGSCRSLGFWPLLHPLTYPMDHELILLLLLMCYSGIVRRGS